MSERVIAISSAAALSAENKQLVIKREGHKKVTVPIEDIGVLFLEGYDVSLTLDLMQQALGAGAAIVVCDSKHHPSGLALNTEAHGLHSAVLRAQVACSEPKKKRVWQQLVQAKIAAQAALLQERGLRSKELLALVPLVRSGDPANVEARAAALYFSRLFGPDFVRMRGAPGPNALLNYGYAILRAMVARALVGAGLHPALGVHHHNQYNPYCLADDAMEPLRPLVDSIALRLLDDDPEIAELTPAIKKELLQLTVFAVNFAGNSVPIAHGLGRYAVSLKGAICGSARKVVIPTP